MIDNCAVYGPTGLPSFTTQSCTSGINTRTVTCAAGYWAQGSGQLTPDINIDLTGNTVFAGCAGNTFQNFLCNIFSEVNECSLYNHPKAGQDELSCTDGVNSRTITCKVGYWAQGAGQSSPDNDIVVIGLVDYTAGCACMFLTQTVI